MNIWFTAKIQLVKAGGFGAHPVRCLGTETVQGTDKMSKLERRWTDLREPGMGKVNGGGGWWNWWNAGHRVTSTGFRVLQWNVLADGLAQNGNFVNVRRVDVEKTSCVVHSKLFWVHMWLYMLLVHN